MSATAAEIQALTQQMKLLTDGMKHLIGAQSQITRSTVNYSQVVKDATNNLEDFESDLQKQGSVSKEQARIQRQLLDAKRDEIRLLKQIEQEKAELARLDRDLAAAVISATEHLNRTTQVRSNLADSRVQLTAAQNEINSLTSSFKTFGASLGGAGKFLNVFVGILGTVANAVGGYFTTVREAAVASAGVIEETSGSFDAGMDHWIRTLARTGVDPKEFIALSAANRQMINSMGGMQSVIDEQTPIVKRMSGLYGDMAKSWKETQGIMTSFANVGVKPTTRALMDYNTDLDMLARTTGMLGPEMNSLFKNLASDADSIDILRAARQGERESILANQRALYISNRALGMTAEQAEQASKMLNKMVAAKPLERFKQAARLRAMGALMGVDTSAAANELMKAKGQQNIGTINEGMTKVATAMGSAAQKGVQAELITSVAAEKLGFDELRAAFDTNLSVTNQSLLNLNEQYKSAQNSNAVMAMANLDIAKAMLTSLTSGQMILGYIFETLDRMGVNILSLPLAIGDFFANIFIAPFFSFLHLITKSLSYIPGLGNIMGGVSDNIGQFLGSIHDMHEQAMRAQKPTNVQEKLLEAQTQGQKNTDTVSKAVATNTKQVEQLATPVPIKEPEQKVVEAPSLYARPTLPGETLNVKMQPNLTKDDKEESATERAERLMTQQLDQSIVHGNKIDFQMKQMVKSSNYLQVIAEISPKLLEVSEKQLAVATMSQEQKDRAAKRMSGESAKFNADYSYAT
jgi:hypothetical protein